MKMQPYVRVLAVPWLQMNNERKLWAPLVIGLGVQVPVLLVAVLIYHAHALAVLSIGIALLIQTLWLIQYPSLRRQNHPNAARLVPGHVRTLRESMVGLWLLLMALTALLPGSGLAWGLLAGAAMLTTALWSYEPWLWIPASFAPMVFPYPGRYSVLRLSYDWWTQPDSPRWALATAAALVMAWLLCLLLRDGGAAHYRSYASDEGLRESLRKSGRPARMWSGNGKLGAPVAALFSTPFRAWMRRLLAQAAPSERSVMARAELALGSHWTAQVSGGLIFLCAFALTSAVAWFGYGTSIWKFRGEASLGLVVGAMSACMATVMTQSSGLRNSKREQALLMLLPGMPRGAGLNRAFARSQLRRALAGWSLAMIFIVGLTAETPVFWSCMAFGLGCLPAALLLWRDWSAVPAIAVRTQALPMLLMLGAGLIGMFLARWLQPSPLCLLAWAGLVVTLGVWRWRRVSLYPQAFPAGRLAK